MHALACLALMVAVVAADGDDCKPGTCRPRQTCCITNIPPIFGCCEYENAVCCPDRIHCCPKDHVCDLQKAACFPKMTKMQEPKSINKLEKRRGSLDEARLFQRKVMCDATTYCPYGSTCCTGVDGSFDCCPYPHSTCCPDKRHCCSFGTVCDATSEYCLEDDDKYATLSDEKEPAMQLDEADLV